MTKISVALATFNGERFLREQLNSLAKQSRLPDELVVSDDGSSDQTLEIINQFAETSPFVVNLLPPQPRLGYRANFMRCAQQCRGDLIFFCDQDDFWDPVKIEWMLKRFEDKRTLAAFHNALLIDSRGNSLGPAWTGKVEEGFRRNDFGSLWIAASGFTIAIRRELLEYNDIWEISFHPGQKERLSHDHWFYFLARSLDSLSYEPKLLAKYRQHAGNAVGWRQETQGIKAKLSRWIFSGLEWQKDAVQAASVRIKTLECISGRLGSLPTSAERILHELEIFRSCWSQHGEIFEARNIFNRNVILLNQALRGLYFKGGDLPGLGTLARDLFVANLTTTQIFRLLNR